VLSSNDAVGRDGADTVRAKNIYGHVSKPGGTAWVVVQASDISLLEGPHRQAPSSRIERDHAGAGPRICRYDCVGEGLHVHADGKPADCTADEYSES